MQRFVLLLLVCGLGACAAKLSWSGASPAVVVPIDKPPPVHSDGGAQP